MLSVGVTTPTAHIGVLGWMLLAASAASFLPVQTPGVLLIEKSGEERKKLRIREIITCVRSPK